MRALRRFPRVQSHSLEALESRIAPAGLVAVDYDSHSGVLTLNGDGSPNFVSIYRTGPAAFRIEGSDTKIHSSAETYFDIGKLTAISIVDNAGSDQYIIDEVSGLTSVTVSLANGSFDARDLGVKGNVQINGGAGSNFYTFTGTTVIGGDLSIGDAGGTNQLQLENSVTIKGGLTYLGGGGYDNLTLRSNGGSSLSVAKGIFFDGSGGSNYLDLGGELSLGKGVGGASLTIQSTGSFVGTIYSDGLTMAGFMEVDTMFSTSSLQMLGAEMIKISGKNSDGQSLVFHGSSAADNLTIDASVLTLAGGLLFDGGAGANTFALGSATSILRFGAATGGVSFAATGGAGVDHTYINAQAINFAGGVDVQPGVGASEFFVAVTPGAALIGKSSLGRSFSYVKSGTDFGEFRLSMTKGTLAGAIHLDGGTGSVLLEESGGTVTIGKEPVTGHSLELLSPGAVYLEGNSLTLAGGIFVDAPNAPSASSSIIPIANSLVIGKSRDGSSVNFAADTGSHVFGNVSDDITSNDPGSLVLRGSLKMAGGEGVDAIGLPFTSAITIPAIDFQGGEGDDQVLLIAPRLSLGTVTVIGGEGEDHLSIIGNGTVTGNVFVNLGTGVEQSVDLRAISKNPGSLKFGGSVSVSTATDASSEEFITVANVTVAKDFLIDLGDADSTVSIDNLFASSVVAIQTLGGVDNVQFERGGFFGASVLKKALNIDLGGGDDTLRLGHGTFDDKLKVLGQVNLNGNDGTDNFNANLSSQNTFTTPPTLTLFDTPVND